MKLRVVLVSLAVAAMSVSPALAQPGGRGGRGPDLGSTFSPNEAREAREQGRHVPLRDIFANIQARFPGRPLGTQLERGQPSIYVIDWLTVDGRKLTVRANAESGAILGVSGG